MLFGLLVIGCWVSGIGDRTLRYRTLRYWKLRYWILAIGYRLSPPRLIAFLCYPIAALPRPIGGLPPSYSLQEASYRALPVP